MKRIVLYHTNWATYDRNFQIYNLPLDAITHLNYCFLNLKETNGGWIPIFSDPWADFEKPIGSSKGNLGALKEAKKRFPFKLGISIGGWSFSKHFSNAVSSDGTRSIFVQGIIDILRCHDNLFDTIDIDWEFISPSGKNYGMDGNSSSPQDGWNFVEFLILLRQSLDNHYPMVEITSCMSGNPAIVMGIPLKEMVPYLGSFNIMTYDFASSSWGECLAGHQTNIYSTPYAQLSIDKAVRAYVNAGVPPEKIVIGAVLYSRGFGCTDGLGCKSSGIVADKSWEGILLILNEDGVCDYKTLPRPGATEYWDEKARASYSYDEKRKILNSYDTPRSIAEKAKYVIENRLQGIMIWESSGDYALNDKRSLLRELCNIFN